MEPSDKIIANPVVVLREEFDDWAVLYNPDTARAVGMNPTAVTVWKLLDGRRSVADVVSAAVGSYADVPDGAEADVASVLARFVDEGFAGVEGAG
jgi:SynChlorMet cassette protein ScmD